MNDENAMNFDGMEPPPSSGSHRRRNGASSARPRGGKNHSREPAARFGRIRRLDIDAATLFGTLLRRWPILALGGISMCALGLLIALRVWGTKHVSTAQLAPSDPSAVSQLVRPQSITTSTLVSMIQTQPVLQKTGARLQPPLSAGEVAAHLDVTVERSTDLINVEATAGDPDLSAAIANAFCQEAILFTRDQQSQEATEAGFYLAKQLAESEADLVVMRKSVPEPLQPLLVAATAAATTTPSRKIPAKIQTARDELDTLLLRYTEAHPLVREQRARLAALTEQFAAASADDVASPAIEAAPAVLRPTQPTGTELARADEDRDVVIDRLRTYETSHAELVTRQRLVNLFKESPPGYVRVLLAASPGDAWAHRPWMKIGAFSGFLGLLGLALAAGGVVSRELLDNRLRTAADVKRVTQLPLLASLGDLRRMSAAEQDSWAFRTWIALQNRMTTSPNRGLVCGVTSALPGDGRTTWINLLAQAASRCGFRVLTVATSPAGTVPGENGAQPADPIDPARPRDESAPVPISVFSTPEEVAQKLIGLDSQPMVHIPLPGWVWNLERRKQWQEALNLWRKIDNVVILVELPPASVPESVLLAENLPNLIWLCESNNSDAAETRSQLETLRHAHGNLVGSVFNRAPEPLLAGRFARWLGCGALLIASLGLSPRPLSAQETGLPPSSPAGERVSADEPASPGRPAPAGEAVSAFSVVASSRRAAWQQRLTLGPGDVLTLGLYGAPELIREEVPVGPDGRISYLEAQSVLAAGLTVDEFRERLGEELAKYRRAPQPMVIPVAYRSKKYFVLGKVVQRGVFTLDRPITIIEAVARARGLETGLSDRNLIELADLSRSFLARGGTRMSVNFEKLFRSGDLTQNIPLEPGDYLYFPAGDQKEVFVLGEVGQPGPLTFGSDTGALAAVAARGGFTDRAWKKRVLVIRGSLNQPELFIVNANDVLAAKTPDFTLQPKDIVYVGHRPWIRAEELLDLAATAFVQAAVVTWTGEKVSRE